MYLAQWLRKLLNIGGAKLASASLSEGGQHIHNIYRPKILGSRSSNGSDLCVAEINGNSPSSEA